jgi:hypothetical protein
MLINDGALVDTYSSSLPPTIKEYVTMLQSNLLNLGGDLGRYQSLPGLLESSRRFSEINSKMLVIPLRESSYVSAGKSEIYKFEEMIAHWGLKICGFWPMQPYKCIYSRQNSLLAAKEPLLL